MRKVVLASESPRRRELMMMGDIPFMSAAGRIEEHLNLSISVYDAAEKCAKAKAENGLNKYPDDFIVGADTFVVVDGEVLGKPEDNEDAYQMLRKLSGRAHEVITGVCILSKDVCEVFHEVSKVHFFELSDEDIWEYIDTRECHDKAGAYAIQGKGLFFIKGIEGDYYNIVGLPMAQLYRRLNKYFEK